jgi:hypothetical protein
MQLTDEQHDSLVRASLRKPVMVFGRPANSLQYEALEDEGCNALYYRGTFIAHYDWTQDPIEIFCNWIDTRTEKQMAKIALENAQLQEMRWLRLEVASIQDHLGGWYD